MFSVCVSVLGEGDEVIVPEPFYATYPGIFAASGATPVHVPLRPEREFQLEVGRGRGGAHGAHARDRPDDAAQPDRRLHARRDAARRSGELCREHDLWLVADEVYGSLLFGGRTHASVLAVDGAEERVAGISSLSKSHAMTGWRTGWAVVPEALVERLVLLLDCMLFGSPPFIADAATTALREADAATAAMRAAYESRAARRRTPRRPGRPALPHAEGGMFIMLDVRACGISATEFAERLLESEGVSVLPIEAFGPSGAGHVRIALAADEEHPGRGLRAASRASPPAVASGTRGV